MFKNNNDINSEKSPFVKKDYVSKYDAEILDVVCSICGEIKPIRRDSYYRNKRKNNGQYICYQCYHKLYHTPSKPNCDYKRLTEEQAKDILLERNILLLNHPVDEDGKFPFKHNKETLLKLKCLTCGNEWESSPIQTLHWGTGCPECKRRKQSESIKERMKINNPSKKYNSTEDINEILKTRNIKMLSPYSCYIKKAVFECLECHETWEGYFIHVFYRGAQCPYCHPKFSNGENLVKSFLDKENIKYKMYYKFDDCRYINPLPFDFYLPDYNCCIEYQGAQHYDENEYNRLCHDSDRDGGFEGQQKRDQIKRDYCKDHNIGYIEIFAYDKSSVWKNKIKDFIIKSNIKENINE